MKFELIDYSDKCDAGSPGQRGTPGLRGGKFVQIRNEETGKEYVVLAPKELSPYHANIVKKFCSEQRKIDGAYNTKKDNFSIRDASWTVSGGGFWTMDSVNRVLELSGSSQAYGRFDRRGLKDKILSLKSMAGFTIRIDGG